MEEDDGGESSARRGSDGEEDIKSLSSSSISSSPSGGDAGNALKTQHAQKTLQILDACESRQLSRLRTLATSSGGLISDEVRRIAWPILLGYTGREEDDVKQESSSHTDHSDGDHAEGWRSLPRHRDEDQVSLDVDRSFIYYPDNQSPKQLDRRKEELSTLITAVLRTHPYLCYFQGYHDICQVFLLVLGTPFCITSVARLSTLRIRDFMLPTLAPALAQLRMIPAILYVVSPALKHHLSQTQPFFALSGTLTMYAHDIQEYGDIARLFDVLLAREAVFSVYMFAQIVLQRSEELFETPADEPEMLHSILSKLPRPLNLEALIANTVQLFDKYPPETLPAWRSISKNSVVKTARWHDDSTQQTVEDGELYFHRQVREMEIAEMRQRLFAALWKYRRPAAAVSMAVFVGVLSIWLRKSPAMQNLGTALQDRWLYIRGK